MSNSLIKKLPDDLINKIAAGEVVERPASVIKELVENSLDAQSTKIDIHLKEGGKKLIEVCDNGIGIAPDQLELAIARHATSKIDSFDDLFALQTKGFRGEALASIASIAQVNIASKTKNHPAHEVIIENGKIIEKKECAHPQGTTVTVKYLFYQTPARLKFLKSKETETSHIVDIITKLAICHPQVSFTITQNEKTLFSIQPQPQEKDRLVKILGSDLSDALYEFSGATQEMSVSGFFGHPQMARSQRNFTYFFVNSRPVQDKILWHAVLEAYRDLLMKGKFPVMVLHLHVKEDQIDVNVHPTKAEVRFHHSQSIHSFIYQTLRQHLQQAPWLKKNESVPENTPELLKQPHQNFSQTSPENTDTSSIKQALTAWSEKYQQPSLLRSSQTRDFSIPQKTEKTSTDILISTAEPDHFNKKPQQKNIQFGKTPYAHMHVIGQFLGTYILCESDGKLILIDQHAAHERIGFEKLLLEFEKSGVHSERLLIPETFDLSPSDADIFKKYLDELLFYGFEIDFFGGNTFVLKAEPGLLRNKIKIALLANDLVADIKETGELVSLKDKFHHILATMSCHAQIRAHHFLTHEEIQALLKELEIYQFTDFCPHGRPVSVEISKDEIEKWFKRVL